MFLEFNVDFNILFYYFEKRTKCYLKTFVVSTEIIVQGYISCLLFSLLALKRLLDFGLFFFFTNSNFSHDILLTQDILKDAVDSNLSSAKDLAYFEGDFWPNVIEDSIRELDQEEEEKRKREEAEAAEAEAQDVVEETVDAVRIFFLTRAPEKSFELSIAFYFFH